MADRPEKGAPLAGKGKSVLGLVVGAALTVFCALYAVPRYGNTGAVLTALALAVLPPLVRVVGLGLSPQWSTWLYRALTFLVISCPCALVISF